MSYALGNIATQPSQKSASTNATIGVASGTVFTLAPGDIGQIQNLAAAALYVKYGASASSTSFTFILPACGTAGDGTSPPAYIDCWIGPVSVKAASGTESFLATVLS